MEISNPRRATPSHARPRIGLVIVGLACLKAMSIAFVVSLAVSAVNAHETKFTTLSKPASVARAIDPQTNAVSLCAGFQKAKIVMGKSKLLDRKTKRNGFYPVGLMPLRWLMLYGDQPVTLVK